MTSACARCQHYTDLLSSMRNNMLRQLQSSGLSRCKIMPPQLPKSVCLSCRAQEAPGWQPRLSPSRLPSEAWQHVKSCAEPAQLQGTSRSHSNNTSFVSLFLYLFLSLSVRYSRCFLPLLLLLSRLDASSASVEPPCSNVSHGSQVIANVLVRMAAACQ